jgi:hypothetical protein
MHGWCALTGLWEWSQQLSWCDACSGHSGLSFPLPCIRWPLLLSTHPGANSSHDACRTFSAGLLPHRCAFPPNSMPLPRPPWLPSPCGISPPCALPLPSPTQESYVASTRVGTKWFFSQVLPQEPELSKLEVTWEELLYALAMVSIPYWYRQELHPCVCLATWVTATPPTSLTHAHTPPASLLLLHLSCCCFNGPLGCPMQPLMDLLDTMWCRVCQCGAVCARVVHVGAHRTAFACS